MMHYGGIYPQMPYANSGYPGYGYQGMPGYCPAQVPLFPPDNRSYGYNPSAGSADVEYGYGSTALTNGGAHMWQSTRQYQHQHAAPYPEISGNKQQHHQKNTQYNKSVPGGVYGSELLQTYVSESTISKREERTTVVKNYFAAFQHYKDIIWMNDHTPDEEWPGTDKLKHGEPFFAVIQHWMTPIHAVVLSVDKMVECCMVSDGAPPEISVPTMRTHFKPERIVQVKLKWPQEFDDKGRPIVELYHQRENNTYVYHENDTAWGMPLMIYRNQAILSLDKSDDVALLYFCELCTAMLDNKMYTFKDFLEKGERIQLHLTRQPILPYHFTYRSCVPWNSTKRLEWANKFPEIKKLVAPCEYDKEFVMNAYNYQNKGGYGFNDHYSQPIFQRPENDADEALYSILPTATSPLTIGEFTKRIGGKLKDVLRFLILQAEAPIDANAQLSVNLAKSIYNFVAERTEFNDIDKHVQQKELEELKGKCEVICLERPPVVVLMGHINHGKTALFDMLTGTNNIQDEPGQITQTVRSFTTTDKCPMTVIDTPGHEVFDAMRRCGATIADIALIVIDSIEGLKEQTIECIKLCKSLSIPFIIAATKCDLPNAYDKTEELAMRLTEEGVIIENLGGDTQFVQVSSKQDTDTSKEAILNAIMLQSAATDERVVVDSPGVVGRGFVLEAGKGQRASPYCLAIIKQGSLTKGSCFVSGKAIAKIKTLKTPDGKRVTVAKPSQAVFVDGFQDDILPCPGDPFVIYENENYAKMICDQQVQEELDIKEAHELQRQITEGLNVLHEQPIKESGIKYIPVVIKGGTQGALNAVKRSISMMKVEGMRTIAMYDIVSGTVGPIYKTDVIDAHDANAIILGLDSLMKADAKTEAKKLGVTVVNSDVIYELMDKALELLRNKLGDQLLTDLYGRARVLKVFDAVRKTKAAGCVVINGRIPKDSAIRVVRNGKPVFAGKLSSLRHTTNSVEEAMESQSCGMIFDGWNDVQVNDIVEAYVP
uniref:Elongation factor Tu GTP binding domain containing protein n=2 Tax=Babesia bovis TaxID=5865 RepID=A7ATK7_BABBO|eukprot:XP_001609836.1 elongation factor Tu GTP binding domain containing protein [Babesia bovis T2Bo]